MTIISHTHKFIYIKARKVASSSLLVALGQHCRDPDIVTSPNDTEGTPNPSRNCQGIKTHTPPDEIRQIVSPEQWHGYTKISCVRNPWDVAVSMLLWRCHRALAGWDKTGAGFSFEFLSKIRSHEIEISDPEYRRHFHLVCQALPRNCTYYFDSTGAPICDVYLRYENLQAELDGLCLRLGLPPTELPRLKSRSRKAGRHYRDYYDDALRDLVAQAAHRTINYFGYEF